MKPRSAPNPFAFCFLPFAFCLFILTSCLFPLLAQEPPSFSKDIAPILSANCLGCHVGGVKMGGLVLDTYDAMLKGGNNGAAIVPGSAEQSRLYLMVAGKMQPSMPLGGKPLAAGEIDIIRKWIDAGAKPPAAGEVSLQLAKSKLPEIEPKQRVPFQIFSLAWSPDGKMLALGGHKEVRLKNVPANTVAGTLTGHAHVVRSVALSADGKRLAASGGLPAQRGEVKIWDVATRSVVRTISGHDDCIYAAAFSPDGKLLATASYDKLVKLWDAETGQEIRTLKDHIDAVYALAFTPGGERLISGAADRTVKVWNTATGERLYTLSDALEGLNAIALDPAGKRVAAGGFDKTIRIWELGATSGALLNSLIAHEDAILKLAWSPDGSMLVSASADRTIKVFRAEDLAEIKVLSNQPDWVYGIEFSPDGDTFAAGRYDGSLSIYETTGYRDRLETRRASR